MKKITLGNESAIYFDFDDSRVGFEWLEMTSGDPITDCESDGDYCDYIANIIANATAEQCDDRDYEYIARVVEEFGI